MHHPDYDRPYWIVWACVLCHKNHHSNGHALGEPVDLERLAGGALGPGAVQRQRQTPLAADVLTRRIAHRRARWPKPGVKAT